MNDAEHIGTLTPVLQGKARQFLQEAANYITQYGIAPEWQGASIHITQSRRNLELQAGLWSQGRRWNKVARKWEIVNEGDIVTRTMDSKHLRGEAFDYAPFKNGIQFWPNPEKPENRKVWLDLAEVGKSVGLKAGADWQKPDWPHFEV